MLGTLGIVLLGVVLGRVLGWVGRVRFRRRRGLVAPFVGALDDGQEEGRLVVRWRDARGQGQRQRQWRVLDERRPLLDEGL